jgi:selenocysteine-specific elongation factor
VPGLVETLMSCIGTAGHVDHGKSTLVQALTGIDPDRLAEEKARGMTIDLGFAWMTLPGGREVSIVDVPGHESFIKNMLAGVGGIDAALLVVAADEGVMPQTREHLAILDLLHVKHGVVALTKVDLVDEEWLELVQEEIAEHLTTTTLTGAPIIPVSAYSRQGLPELLATLERILDETEERQNVSRPRLPIDRVFTITGFGTIVTGTLVDGSFKMGQEVEVLPQGLKTRVRNLQMHKHAVEAVQPGSRVAINLANVARSDLARGDVVTLPGQFRTTMLLDARIHLLPDTERPLTHNMQVDFYCGAQEISARVRLLDVDELAPADSAWVQLRLNRPALVARRDRFILRIPSPSTTIGGGEVVDAHPRYHRRYQRTVLSALERLALGSPEELVLAALDRRGAGGKVAQVLTGYELVDIARQSNLAEDVTQQILQTFLIEERACRVGPYWFATHVWDALVSETLRIVGEQHRQYPLRRGLSKEMWRTRLHLAPKMAAEVFAVLQAEGQLEAIAEGGGPGIAQEPVTRSGGLIRLPGFEPTFNPAQQRNVDQLLQRFKQNPYTPPTRAEAEEMTNAEIISALIERGTLVKLNDGVLFLHETYEDAVNRLLAFLREHHKMTVAEARDILGATRKYILPLLEQLDSLRITRRVGDERVLGLAGDRMASPGA